MHMINGHKENRQKTIYIFKKSLEIILVNHESHT